MTRDQIKTALIMLAGVAAVWILWDYLNSAILAAVGIGGAAAAASKKADQSKVIADEHEQMADIRVAEAVKEVEQAEQHHEKALEIANGIEDMTPTPKPGKTRKKFEIR